MSRLAAVGITATALGFAGGYLFKTLVLSEPLHEPSIVERISRLETSEESTANAVRKLTAEVEKLAGENTRVTGPVLQAAPKKRSVSPSPAIPLPRSGAGRSYLAPYDYDGFQHLTPETF
jgi:hypothetical protein